MSTPHFIIYASSYDDRIGGIMVQHELCDRINRVGGRASIWPYGLPIDASPRRWRTWLRYFISHAGTFSYGPHPARRARRKDIKNAIVIYPEIVDGNPLEARLVVRWLLHRPGFHTGAANYGPEDWVGYFNPAFDGPCPGRLPHFPLRVTAQVPAYRQTNFGARHGSAVLFRKGRDRERTAHPPDSIVVDGMSHEQMAAVFNQVERLYSYDLHSFTTTQAAMCGSIPIVVPFEDVSEEDWQPRRELRLGVAYGEARIPWAVNTREALLDQLTKEQDFENCTVDRLLRILD